MLPRSLGRRVEAALVKRHYPRSSHAPLALIAQKRHVRAPCRAGAATQFYHDLLYESCHDLLYSDARENTACKMRMTLVVERDISGEPQRVEATAATPRGGGVGAALVVASTS